MNERPRAAARDLIAPEDRRYSETTARRPRIGADVSSALAVAQAAASLPRPATRRTVPALPRPLRAAADHAHAAGLPTPPLGSVVDRVVSAWGAEPASADIPDAAALAVAAAADALLDHAAATAGRTAGTAAAASAAAWSAALLSCHRDLLAWLAATASRVRQVDDTLEMALTRARRAGADGEALAWAAITAETRRHHGLVRERARRLSSNLPGHSIDDLVGYGWEGLRTALRNYDPAVSAFATYAVHRIDGRIRDGVRAESPVPKRLTTVVNKHARTVEELTQALGRPPALEEVSARMGAHAAYLHLMPRLTQAASLQELAGSGDDDRREVSCLIDPSDTADQALASVMAGEVHAAVESLGPDADLARMLWLEGQPAVRVRASLGMDVGEFAIATARARASLARSLDSWRPAEA